MVRRAQQKKSMKTRIKNLRDGMRVAFEAGRESVLLAGHQMSYGEGYAVGEMVPDSVLTHVPVELSPVATPTI
jgi:hypothetical protein